MCRSFLPDSMKRVGTGRDSEPAAAVTTGRGRCPNCGEPGDPPLYAAPGVELDGTETDGVLHCGCYYEAEPYEVHCHFTEALR